MAIIYNKENGQILTYSDVDFNENVIEHIEQKGQGCNNEIKGEINVKDYYYDLETHNIVPLPQKPNDYSYFDYDEKEWKLNEGLAKQRIRTKRDQLLKECDWTQLDDVPLQTKREWQIYRQDLRDLTDQRGFPENVNWPIPPQ